MMQKSSLDNDRVGLLLWKFSVTAFFGMFITMLYNVVDTIFVGHYVGALGIAGLTFVLPIQILSMGIGMLAGVGGASVVSRAIGADNRDRAERALGNSITLVIISSVIMTIAGLSNVDFWLRLIGCSETILPYARDYMSIILCGIFFQTFGMALTTLIRAEGNARVPMIGMITGGLLNIVFCAVFITLLGWGVKGSALAAVIGQIFVFIYYLIFYLRDKSFLKLHRKDFIPEMDILRGILGIGIGSFMMTLSNSISAILVNLALINYGGDPAISAFGILNRLMMFVNVPGMSIGQGLQPIVGFNYGARRYGRILDSLKIATIFILIYGVLAFILLYFYPEPLVRIFTSESDLIALSSYASKRLFLAVIIVSLFFVGAGIFQSIGKVVQSFVTNISRSVFFLIPLIFILPHFWGIDGVWLAYPITDTLSFLLTMALLIPQIKEFRAKTT